MSEKSEGSVYLLHFSPPVPAREAYLGYAKHLDARLAHHGKASGARLMQVVREAGIDWTLARTWAGGRDRERQLKNQGGKSRMCPLCGVQARKAA